MRAPGPLVDTDWLADHLDAASGVIEATAYLDPPSKPGKAVRRALRPGRVGRRRTSRAPRSPTWWGAGRAGPELNFTFPSHERFAAGMSALGVEDGTMVVIYDRNGMMWATRLWWLLRAYGFDDAAVLDGGWRRLDGRRPAGSTDPPARRDANSPRAPVPRSWRASTRSRAARLPAQRARPRRVPRRGEPLRPRRPDPGRVNVYAKRSLDPETGRLLPRDALRERSTRSARSQDGRVVAYCGGGISATLDAFALTLLGRGRRGGLRRLDGRVDRRPRATFGRVAKSEGKHFLAKCPLQVLRLTFRCIVITALLRFND